MRNREQPFLPFPFAVKAEKRRQHYLANRERLIAYQIEYNKKHFVSRAERKRRNMENTYDLLRNTRTTTQTSVN